MRIHMVRSTFRLSARRLGSLLALALLAGCSAARPYVYHNEEFNRSRPDYAQAVGDINQVTICYSSLETTPRQVAAMALAECAKFSKTIRYVKHDYAVCPLITPAAAVFACVKKR